MGAIIITIPKGIYKSVEDPKTNLGYRMSLENYDMWAKQYGGGFSSEIPVNVISSSKITHMSPTFNIYYGKNVGASYGSFKMTVYECYDDSGNLFNMITTTKGINSRPTFIFDYHDKVMYPHAILSGVEVLENLLQE